MILFIIHLLATSFLHTGDIHFTGTRIIPITGTQGIISFIDEKLLREAPDEWVV
jgi:hypothetical protein